MKRESKIVFLYDIDKLLVRLEDLHRQATVERSHYYTGAALKSTIDLLLRIKTEWKVEGL